ncbi:Universal stress A-like protein [Nymphaea thermarum]|nr:Universal stress A-like protein [Nymphaea thermarum]
MASSEGNYVTLDQALSEEAAATEEAGAAVKKVLVAVDHSEGSFLALRWALDHLFADENQDFGSLILLHAQLPFKHKAHPAGTAVDETQTVVESVRKDQEHIAGKLLERAASECNQKHVRAELRTAEGEPKEVICEVAEQLHADLVVVGSRGLGTIKRAFLGSVSDYVAHHAKCPVLIVKPPKRKHQHDQHMATA